MNRTPMLLALGASLSLGLANLAKAETNTLFHAEKLSVGYGNADANVKLAEHKCGNGACGSKEHKNANHEKTSNGHKKPDASSDDKNCEGKCGAGKCGAGKCGAHDSDTQT